MSFAIGHQNSIIDKNIPLSLTLSVFNLLPFFVYFDSISLPDFLTSVPPQDDRLRTPLLKLKLAVCSVMPEQIARYNMDCMAKVAK